MENKPISDKNIKERTEKTIHQWLNSTAESDIIEGIKLINVDGIYFSESALEYFESNMIPYGVPRLTHRDLTDTELQKIRNIQSEKSVMKWGIPANSIRFQLSKDALDETDDPTSDIHQKMKRRNIQKHQLQPLIDNSLFMFDQRNGSRRAYVSGGGNITILVKNERIVSVYLVSEFDKGTRELVGEVKTWLRIQ